MTDLNNIPTRQSAISVAQLAAENDALVRYLDKQGDAKVEAKGSAAHVMVMLMGIYDNEAFASFPVPGTTADDVKGTNKPYDKYEVEGTKPDGSVGQVKGEFYKDFLETLPNGKKLRHDIEAIKKAKKGAADADAKFKSMGQAALDRELNRANTKYNYALDMLRKSVALWQKIQEVNELESEGVVAELAFKLGENGEPMDELEKTTLPITLAKTTAPRDLKAMSVGAFLALNIERAKKIKAEKNVSMFTALKDSAKRGTKSTTSVATESEKLTFKNFPNVILDVANFVDDRENYSKFISILGKDDDMLLTLADLQDALDGMTSKFERRIDDLRIARANNEKQQAA